MRVRVRARVCVCVCVCLRVFAVFVCARACLFACLLMSACACLLNVCSKLHPFSIVPTPASLNSRPAAVKELVVRLRQAADHGQHVKLLLVFRLERDRQFFVEPQSTALSDLVRSGCVEFNIVPASADFVAPTGDYTAVLFIGYYDLTSIQQFSQVCVC